MEGEEVCRGRWQILAVLCLSVVIIQLDTRIAAVRSPRLNRGTLCRTERHNHWLGAKGEGFSEGS